MKRLAAAILVAALAIVSIRVSAAAQAAVHNLRMVADESGTPLPETSTLPGEKQYHLDSGTTAFFIAYDCETPKDSRTQVRVMQPPGAVLFQQDGTCAAGGTQVVKYDQGGEAFADNDYVVNLYVGDDELYLADSVQLTVGSAVVPTSDLQESTPIVGQGTPSVSLVPTIAVETGGTAGGPSRWLLAIAALGILGLVGVVLWAGWSAMRR